MVKKIPNMVKKVPNMVKKIPNMVKKIKRKFSIRELNQFFLLF